MIRTLADINRDILNNENALKQAKIDLKNIEDKVTKLTIEEVELMEKMGNVLTLDCLLCHQEAEQRLPFALGWIAARRES
jgi:hypothetical protein